MKIGTISDSGNGNLRTLKLDMKFKVEKIASDGPRGDNEPTHRIISNGVEIGAAWTKERRDDGSKFLSITIDDPSFEAPLNVAAFPNDDRGYDVVWNRPRRQQEAT